MSDKELDNLFKEAADGFKVPNDPAAWQQMAKKLDGAGVGASGFWNWKTISSMVMVGVTSVAIVWYLSSTEINNSNSKAQSSIVGKESELKLPIETVTPTIPEKSKQLQKNAIKNDLQAQAGDKAKGKFDANRTKDKDTSTSDFSNTNKDSQQGNVQPSMQPASSEKSTESVQSTERSEQSTSIVQSGVESTQSKENSTTDIAKNDKAKAVLPAAAIAAGDTKTSISVDSKKAGDKNVSNDDLSSSSSNSELTSNSSVESNSTISNEAIELSAQDSTLAMKENVKNPRVDSSHARTSKEVPKEKKSLGKRFSVKIAIAPDYSTVENSTPDKLGISYGILFEYHFSTNWSVATGGIWSKKIYTAENVEYNTRTVDWVDGDCRMWDIPVNVYYTFSPNRQFSFYAGLGLSSYIMNEENYVLYYETPYGTYDYPIQVKGENNEWFKTLNASIGMQLRLTEYFSIQVEPIIKAPLAGVGEGEVSLASLGAFLNLRFDIPVNRKSSKQ